MFPTVYDYTATNLNTQGYGSLSDCISCEVTEELNGGFTLEMTYPLNGIHAENLIPSNIIMAKPSHNQSRQPFRISQVKKSFANNIQVYANHICYDLSGYPVRAASSYNSLSAVIDAMNAMTWDTGDAAYNPFIFETDMTSSASFSMEGIQSVRSWMGGQEGSILDVYGGEWSYDLFRCFLNSRRGTDTGYRISYGKNLAEYEKQRDYVEYSHICAYWKKSEVTVYSDLQATPLECAFRCGYVDVSSSFETQPTTAQLNTLAAEYAATSNGLSQTITITPAQIGNKVIGLGDSVLICYETVLQTRVIKTVWDAIAGEYKTLQLGTKKASITDTIKSITTAPSGSSGGSTPITITVDSELSTISTNPVQNKVITNALAGKVNAESGKGLSTNDFTTTEKNKLAGIASGAEVNVQSDWNVTSTTSDAYIKNKPTIPTKTSELTNDSGFITDAGVTSFNGATGAVTYTAPVTSVNSKTGAVTLDASDVGALPDTTVIPTKTSDLTNDSNFVSDASYVHTDNNFTTAEKTKLDGIEAGAEVNVQADWNVTDTTSDAYIKNKPTIPPSAVVDDELSSTSGNPVQNRVIYSALQSKTNQNAFSYVRVNNTLLSADSPTDILNLVAGANISFLPDTSSDTIGISANFSYQPSYYQATGSSGTLSLANGTITQIPLVATGAISGGNEIFSISGGGIQVLEAGNYKITGSVFLGTVNAIWACGCYIKKGTSFSASSEIFNANIGKDIASGPQFGVTAGSKVVTLDANDIVFLCARVQGGNGTAYKDNRSTYLLIEKV